MCTQKIHENCYGASPEKPDKKTQLVPEEQVRLKEGEGRDISAEIPTPKFLFAAPCQLVISEPHPALLCVTQCLD